MANRYWVGNGGNWDTTTHWSTTSGGSSGASVPDVGDNVYFDANSFSSSGQTVTIDTPFWSCKDMDWSAVTNNPTLNFNGNDLGFYGTSLVFSANMTLTFTSTRLIEMSLASTVNITSAGKTLPNIVAYDNGGTPGVSLQDNLTCGYFDLAPSTDAVNLDTNNYDINCNGFQTNANATVDLGTSTITSSESVDFDWQVTGGSNLTASQATVVLTGSGTYFYANTPHNVGTVTFSQNGTLVAANSTIGTLNLTPGKTLTVDVGFGTTTYLNNLNATGTPGNVITITSASAHTLSKSSGNVSCDYLNLTNSVATGGAVWYAGWHSTDTSGNTGWKFRGAPASEFFGFM